MKKSTFFAAFFMFAQLAFAGGLLTNTNQSGSGACRFNAN